MNKKTLCDFQTDWEKLVDKALSDYSLLNPDERIWFNVQCLMDAVDNGGLISHYYNSGADHNKETIADLTTLGLLDIADMLLQINKRFPGNAPSVDIDERNDVIDSWEEDDDVNDWLDQLDHQFFNREQELEQKLVNHLERTLYRIA